MISEQTYYSDTFCVPHSWFLKTKKDRNLINGYNCFKERQYAYSVRRGIITNMMKLIIMKLLMKEKEEEKNMILFSYNNFYYQKLHKKCKDIT